MEYLLLNLFGAFIVLLFIAYRLIAIWTKRRKDGYCTYHTVTYHLLMYDNPMKIATIIAFILIIFMPMAVFVITLLPAALDDLAEKYNFKLP